MKNIKLLLTTAIIVTLTSCVNGDDYNTPDLTGECFDIPVTKQVSEITSISTPDNPVQYIDPRDAEGNQIEVGVIEAYVTSSDEGGNFYKSISMVSVDKQIGFSIPVDNYNLYTKYEPGRKVFVKLDSLYYSYTNLTDSYEIGDLYYDAEYNEFSIGRLSGVEYQNIIVKSCEKVNEDDLVENITIDQAQDDFYINKLVEFDAVQFTDGSIEGKYYDSTYPDLSFSSPTYPSNIGGATNHQITDVNGNKIVVRVSQYAGFASNIVPTGSGKIRGVLTKYNGGYQFMIRTLNDVKLDNPRIVGFYTEDFQSATNNTNLDITGWTNFAEQGSWVWREKTFSGNGYAEFSSYNSGAALNVAWLVSPAINLDNTVNELLTFKVAQHHLDVDSPGNSLQVYISTDFDGTNVLAATWVTVPANIPTTATSWYEFIGTSYDISGYNGDVYIAFKFTGSGTNTTLDGAFQIDDINVYGG